MADELIARFRRWFEYERDAHAKVFASLATVPAERQGGPEYRKAVSLLGHIVIARRLWLGRLGAGPLGVGSVFPDHGDAARVADEWREVEAAWADYLARLSDADLARAFDYQSLDAGRFRNKVEDILAQLFGHSSYHRGQIAMLVRAAGGTPAATDLVYWCREASG